MTRRNGFLDSLTRLFRPAAARTDRAPEPRRSTAGTAAATVTVEVHPRSTRGLQIHYAPRPDGEPDAGEIVWTWVPYAENDGRGKDRPVLVIARHSESRVYAVKLTSRSHDGERDFLSIGAGAWDPQRRPSWVDIDQLYSVHPDGMRREASALDAARFARVADALCTRYGWSVED